jgi:hypothetical protein
MDTTSGCEDKRPDIENWGCFIMGLATLLFAFQRYIAFRFLLHQTEQGSQISQQFLMFLFGKPPFSISDIFLGFQLFDEGVIFILQPRSWLIAIVQGIHFGLNIGIAYIPIWPLSRFKYWSSLQKRLACGGCIVIIILGAVVTLRVLNSLWPSQPSDISLVAQEQFSDPEFGVSFEYPDYLSLETNVQKDRGPDGELVTMKSILAASVDPTVAIYIKIIEDPLRNERFPDLYPPTEETLRTLTVGDISQFEFPRSEENKEAVLMAAEEATFTTICGYTALTYDVTFSSLTFKPV